MKKKKIELSRKLFMKKDTISSLGARQSEKVIGGWATHYAESQIVANPEPYCQSCVEVPPFQTNEDSVCKCLFSVGGGITCQINC